MNRHQSTTFANFLLSLPLKARSLREQADTLLGEAEALEEVLAHLDQEKLNKLDLTNNRKLDAAVILSAHTGVSAHIEGRSNHDRLVSFGKIYQQLLDLEGLLASWDGDGLSLIDLTSQSSCPLCLQLVALQTPPSPGLAINLGPGYFHDIPISVQIPGRVVAAWNSNTSQWSLSDEFDLSTSDYQFSEDGFRVKITKIAELDKPVTTSFDVTPLFHPNWGASRVPLAGVFLGRKAVSDHIDAWKDVVGEGYCMSPEVVRKYLKFLDDFSETVHSFETVMAKTG